MTLGDFGSLFGGLTGKSKADFQAGGARYVSYMNVFENLDDRCGAQRPCPGRRSSNGSGRCSEATFCSPVRRRHPRSAACRRFLTRKPPQPLYLNSFCIGYRPHDDELLDPEFAKHLFRSASMRRQIVRTANGVTRFNVSKARLAKVEMPLPSLHEQRQLAEILDRFDALVNDLSVGLPAELAARRRQYEYYRDNLLSFEEAA